MISAATPAQLNRLATLAGFMGQLPGDLSDQEQNITWAAEQTGPAWGDLGRGYLRVAKESGYVAANRQLHDFAPLVRADLYLAADDSDIRAFCDRRVKECNALFFGALGRRVDTKQEAEAVTVGLMQCSAVFDRYGLPWPAPASPITGPGMDLMPLVRRLGCKQYWRRLVRTFQAREVGRLARLRQKVAKYRQCYVDDWNIKRWQAANERNHETLSQTVATNDSGQEYTLAELAELGQANMANRRNELMVRIRGFEEVATARGHVGDFWTVTAAGYWHRMRWLKKPGKAVPVERWNESTPRQVQDHLCKLWAQARAELDRLGVRFYGFRVVEPHHCGTPHWHMMIFLHPDDRTAARKVMRRYFLLADAPKERGAWRSRFTAKAIDPAKGSAAAYCAKYIAKNIDGAGVRGALQLADDDSGLSMSQGAVRVRAWASTWGIRQFQQLGGPSVTVWREMRRLAAFNESESYTADLFGNEAAAAAVEAADAGDWAAFVEYMGGPILPRVNRPCRPAYWVEVEKVDPETGEVLAGDTKYGEAAAGQVFGLWVWDRTGGAGEVVEQPCMTRFHRWDIEHRPGKAPALPELETRAFHPAEREVPEWVRLLANVLTGKGHGLAGWRGFNPFAPPQASALDLCQ